MADGHVGNYIQRMQTLSKEIIGKIGRIRLLLTDCDGVLTDGSVYYSANGEQMKRFSVRDGLGVERLQKLVRIETGLITGENSEIVMQRVEKLGIREYHPGCLDKFSKLKEILSQRKYSADMVAYIGDDFNDEEIMRHVGLSASPADALPAISEVANLVMANKGGYGAFREFAEIIIYYKKNHNGYKKESAGWGSHYW